MIEMSPQNRTFNSRGERHLGNFKPSAKARICLDCDLPSKNCNKSSCKRYNKMMRDLLNKNKDKKLKER